MGAEDGFEEVAAENTFFVADGGEVGAGVPFLKECEIGCEALVLRYREWRCTGAG